VIGLQIFDYFATLQLSESGYTKACGEHIVLAFIMARAFTVGCIFQSLKHQNGAHSHGGPSIRDGLDTPSISQAWPILLSLLTSPYVL
jgi:hypothetical protein